MSFIVGRHIAASCVRALTHTAWRCRAVGASCKCVDVALVCCLLTLFSLVKDLSPQRVRQCGEYQGRTDDLLHAMQAL